jgi:transcriptional regulator with XRE-family HTH domain
MLVVPWPQRVGKAGFRALVQNGVVDGARFFAEWRAHRARVVHGNPVRGMAGQMGGGQGPNVDDRKHVTGLHRCATVARQDHLDYRKAMQPTDPKTMIRVAREAGGEAHVEPLNLGHRVRELRRSLGWTLEEAASRAGLARSTLSKIENGMTSPTFDILQKIVIGLSLDLVDLFDSRPHAAPPGRRSITRRGEGSRHPTRTYGLELLATDLVGKQFLPFKARIVARRLEDFEVWGRHEGEEFLLVLSGEVIVHTEFYAPARLVAGDSAYFDSRMGHAVISVSDEDAEVLWVSSGSPPPART